MDGVAALVRLLRVAGAAVLALGLVALALNGDSAHAASAVLVALLVGIPLGRVALLAVDWFRRGDRRFAWAAVSLLGVVVAGLLAAVFQRQV